MVSTVIGGYVVSVSVSRTTNTQIYKILNYFPQPRPEGETKSLETAQREQAER